MPTVNLPKTVTRTRKEKYTQNRSPYKKYKHADWSWCDVYEYINNAKNDGHSNYIQMACDEFGIKYGTMRDRYGKYQKHCENSETNDMEHRGGTNKLFANDEEREMYEYIISNYVDNNRPLNNGILKQIAVHKYNEISEEKKENLSDGWCTMFKKRWNLSTQRVKASKVASNVPTEEEINEFLNTFGRWTQTIKSKNIFNYDCKQRVTTL